MSRADAILDDSREIKLIIREGHKRNSAVRVRKLTSSFYNPHARPQPQFQVVKSKEPSERKPSLTKPSLSDSKDDVQTVSSSPAKKHVRPHTPEQHLKRCLDCDQMQEFILNLQKEVKRLQNYSNDLNMHIILQGGTPKEPTLPVGFLNR